MFKRGRGRPVVLAILLAAVIAAAGCASLQESSPIIPVSEYEKLIAGRLDADYVGNDACLAKCHEHDQYKKWFDASTMGAQLSPGSGLPLVNCESCHGPGSLAIANIKVINGKPTCDFSTFIDLENLPKQAQSLICLKCHTANATFNLQYWNSSIHNISGVSCFDCHKVHRGVDLKVRAKDVAALCYKCHPYIKAEFSLPNHHPVNEGRVTCLDCHDPHGSAFEKQLKEGDMKQLCGNCHAEKAGPFAFEHADITNDCRNCHAPHGSVNLNMLKVRMPYLCYQCHDHHSLINNPEEIQRNKCTDCHTEIHGSDTPDLGNGGAFTR
ncbi:MAG: DmsE family decaheme c-type cytochrome [Nitrospirota bacterium]